LFSFAVGTGSSAMGWHATGTPVSTMTFRPVLWN